MSNVSAITPQHRSIAAPAELRQLPGWLIWRFETHAGVQKPLKVPYYVDGGRRFGQQGGPVDRAKLTTFADARDAAARRGFDGVGLAMLHDWGITALDFDACVDADGRLPPEVEAVVCNTYAEYSPSGLGVRAFVRGNLGNHKDIARPGRYGFETFNTNGFVTFTGRALPAVEILGLDDYIAPVDEAVLAMCDQRFGASSAAATDADDPFAGHEPRIGLSISQMEALVSVLDPDMPRDVWIKVGMALHHETEGGDDGFAIWHDWSSQAGHKYVGEDDLTAQWDSFTRRTGSNRRMVTMASVMRMAKELGASIPRPTQAASADALRAVAADTIEAMEGLPAAQGRATPDGYTGKFPVVSANALSRREPGAWLIKGVLPQADLVVLFGASGAGKSFAAIDMAAAVARGMDWRGNRVRKGGVIIIAAEGGGGVGKRIKAYCQHHRLDPCDLDIGIITAAPNFLLQEDIGEVTASVVAAGGADLLVVDTFAQVTPGANENTAEDMGLALAHAKALREATGAVIMLVHHAGKDASRGARGWSGIKAAADAEIEVVRHETGGREIRVSKMKDGDDGVAWGFALDVVVVGTDADGDAVTSCVAVEADLPRSGSDEVEDRKDVKRLGRLETHIVDMIETVDPALSDTDLYDFVNMCAMGIPEPEPGKRDARRYNTMRAVRSLAKGKEPPFTIEHGRVVFCK